MAKKPSYKQYENNVNFADCTLRAEEASAFEHWYETVIGDEQTWRSEVLDAGWKVSEKYDFNNMCYQASWTMQDPKDKNANTCVVSRSRDMSSAWFMNAYKVFVLFEDQALPVRGPGINNWG